MCESTEKERRFISSRKFLSANFPRRFYKERQKAKRQPNERMQRLLQTPHVATYQQTPLLSRRPLLLVFHCILYRAVAFDRTALSAGRNFGMAVCRTGDSRSINVPGSCTQRALCTRNKSIGCRTGCIGLPRFRSRVSMCNHWR